MNKLFTATWCNPCKDLKKWLKEENIQDVEIIDVDENPDAAAEAGVRGLPAMVTKEGNLIATNEVIRPYLKGEA